jgi:hypothetical protein
MIFQCHFICSICCAKIASQVYGICSANLLWSLSGHESWWQLSHGSSVLLVCTVNRGVSWHWHPFMYVDVQGLAIHIAWQVEALRFSSLSWLVFQPAVFPWQIWASAHGSCNTCFAILGFCKGNGRDWADQNFWGPTFTDRSCSCKDKKTFVQRGKVDLRSYRTSFLQMILEYIRTPCFWCYFSLQHLSR